jgi:hypothetical protein
MFFRRERQREITFDDRIAELRKRGFSTDSLGAGKTLVSRKGCAAIVTDASGKPEIGISGILVGAEVAILVDGGYQKFFQTPDGHKYPALASHLTAMHSFHEDMVEALGLQSYYNESLGTVCESHMYDRVKDRDRGVGHQAWDK